MRVLFERLVVGIESGLEGDLKPRPGAIPRREPATSEGRIHRALADLADATPEQIAAFASIHGLLRRGAPWLTALASPAGQRPLAAGGQRMADDLALAREWLEMGASGEPPANIRETLTFAAVMAELPEAVHRGFTLAMEGKPEALVEKVVGNALPDPAAFFSSMSRLIELNLRGAGRLPADRARLLRGLDELEWPARLLGGVDAAPEWVNALGGAGGAMLDLLRNEPEALLAPQLLNERNAESLPLIEELATETVGDWLEVADGFAKSCATVRLVRRALGGEVISRERKVQLLDLYRALAEFDAPTDLTVGELGERVLPLVRAELEAALVQDGVWPIRRGSVTGLYSRALVALWTELTDERPLVACATPGCPGSFVLAHGRLYCAACQAKRRQEAVRSSRARAAERSEAD